MTVQFVQFSIAALNRPKGIPCYRLQPGDAGRATVIVVHGLGDHGQALPYEYLASALVNAGYAAISFDQRGHGAVSRAEKARTRLPDLVDDLVTVATHCRAAGMPRPLVVVGLSMGAMVATLACAREPQLVEGFVAASPPIGPVAAGRLAIVTAKILGGVLPGLALSSGIDISSITDNAEALAAYTGDPLFHETVRLGLASDLLAAAQGVREASRTMITPALFLHGERDRVAMWNDETMAMLSRPGWTVRTFEEGYHNLFLDHGRGEVFDAIVQWIGALSKRRQVEGT